LLSSAGLVDAASSFGPSFIPSVNAPSERDSLESLLGGLGLCLCKPSLGAPNDWAARLVLSLSSEGTVTTLQLRQNWCTAVDLQPVHRKLVLGLLGDLH